MVPDNPLGFIQGCVIESKVLWTYHVNMRLKGRFISRQDIIKSYQSYEIIEHYSGDKFFPSYLIRSEYQNEVFHILFAVDMEGHNIRVVTAYRPDREEWGEDYRKRRQYYEMP
jgi:hypothetical protein